jgi:hypothetical protein
MKELEELADMLNDGAWFKWIEDNNLEWATADILRKVIAGKILQPMEMQMRADAYKLANHIVTSYQRERDRKIKGNC